MLRSNILTAARVIDIIWCQSTAAALSGLVFLSDCILHSVASSYTELAVRCSVMTRRHDAAQCDCDHQSDSLHTGDAGRVTT
jgi:hypothetical protein